MQVRGVFCEVRTDYLRIIQINFTLPKGRTVAEANGVLPRRPGFDPWSVVRDLWCAKWYWAQVFLRVLRVSPLSVSIHHCSIRVFIYMLLLPEGQEIEDWEPTKKQRPFVKRGVLDR